MVFVFHTFSTFLIPFCLDSCFVFHNSLIVLFNIAGKPFIEIISLLHCKYG